MKQIKTTPLYEFKIQHNRVSDKYEITDKDGRWAGSFDDISEAEYIIKKMCSFKFESKYYDNNGDLIED